jgi:hypothetical protein
LYSERSSAFIIRIAAMLVKAFHSNTIAGGFDDRPSG